MKTNLNS